MAGRHSSSRTAWVGVVCLALPVGGQSQRRIAYASQRAGNTDVRIMKASGSGDRRVVAAATCGGRIAQHGSNGMGMAEEPVRIPRRRVVTLFICGRRIGGPARHDAEKRDRPRL